MLDDRDFFGPIEASLETHPAFRSLLPPGYPRRGSFRVVKERALAFETERNRKYAHNVNLPLALFRASSAGAQAGVRSFMSQILRSLESFVTTFEGVSGHRAVLEPLWTAGWDINDPSFLSVVSHAELALALRRGESKVTGFEVPTGSGNATADIAFAVDDEAYLLDIEMWHAVAGEFLEETHQRMTKRAVAKAEKKFAHHVAETVPIVAEVCFAFGANHWSMTDARKQILTPFVLETTVPSICLPSMVIGVGSAAGEISAYQYIQSDSVVPPPAPGLRADAVK